MAIVSYLIYCSFPGCNVLLTPHSKQQKGNALMSHRTPHDITVHSTGTYTSISNSLSHSSRTHTIFRGLHCCRSASMVTCTRFFSEGYQNSVTIFNGLPCCISASIVNCTESFSDIYWNSVQKSWSNPQHKARSLLLLFFEL